MPLTTSVLHDDGVALLALGGELDLETLGLVAVATTQVLEAGFTQLVVDLTGLEFCDSSGLGALMRTSRAVRETGGRCLVAGAAGPVRRLLALTDLGRVLHLEDDVGLALASCHREVETAGDIPEA